MTIRPPDTPAPAAPAARSAAWRWYICILLLMATMVNYMDRLTTNTLSVEIQREFKLNDQEYGNLELGFGLAFAAGGLIFGFLVDRMGVYWLYPAILVGWSAAGFLTGLSRTYGELLLLRIMLGLFEAGHFPCGLKVVQILMEPRDRAMGNSLLQSGTALGAVLAPQVIRMLTSDTPDGWRAPFLIIGAGGCGWIVFWLASIRPADLPTARTEAANNAEAGKSATAVETAPAGTSFLSAILSWRYLALAIMVVCINMTWHIFRVWMPKFLREARGYERDEMLNFSSLYYLFADVGSIGAGVVSGMLARRGLSVFGSRIWVFAGCCVLCTFTTAAAMVPPGPVLTGSLLLMAAGSLGCFTAYYSLTQDISREHQGKVSGSLSTITWVMTAAFHPLFGRYLDATKNYDLVIGAAGWLPFTALAAVLLLWRSEPSANEAPPAYPAKPG